VCTHNSARSQLAVALWTRRNAVPAASAGTTPAARVHPRAVRVARRHGLAIGRARPVNVASVLHRDDLVIAVCDKAYEQLADTVGLHWSIPDPAPVDTDHAFESVYADIARRIDRLSRAIKGVRP
jgi:protein-tyrosine-phosphatase